MAKKAEALKNMTEQELDARHAEKMKKKKAARDKIIATKTREKGLVMVHTGKGKGKTSDSITASSGSHCTSSSPATKWKFSLPGSPGTCVVWDTPALQ